MFLLSRVFVAISPIQNSIYLLEGSANADNPSIQSLMAITQLTDPGFPTFPPSHPVLL